MSDSALDALRFPVGRFAEGPAGSMEQRAGWIDTIAQTPAIVSGLVTGWSTTQLATPYRPNGWTVAQTIHHMVDSHVNAYLRTKWALTETGFVVKPYDQTRWAELPDAKALDVGPSLSMLSGVHARWVMLLRTFGPAEFSRTLEHPERGPMTIDSLVQLYDWHSRHHAAHIAGVKAREGW